MHPELFRLGDFALHSYGACLAAGILAAYYALMRLARRRGMDEGRLSNLVTLLVVGGLAGARVFFVAEHWNWYRGDLLAALKVWEGGLVYYGSLVAGAALLALWCVATRTAPLAVFDLFAAVVPLGQAFGRLGCFLNGCCHGRVADTFASVRYPAGSIPWRWQVGAGLIGNSSAVSLPVIPAQLVEAAGCLVLSLALCSLHRSRKSQERPGLVVGAYLAAYGALRFFTETLRADERAHPFGGALTISQCISVAAIAAGAALLLLAAARTRGEVKVRPDA